jgi:hypothetical protein
MNYVQKKAESFRISDKDRYFSKVAAHTGMRVDLASEFGLPVSTMNTTVKYSETTQCGNSSKQ